MAIRYSLQSMGQTKILMLESSSKYDDIQTTPNWGQRCVYDHYDIAQSTYFVVPEHNDSTFLVR